jgi:hypothetical protein
MTGRATALVVIPRESSRLSRNSLRGISANRGADDRRTCFGVLGLAMLDGVVESKKAVDIAAFFRPKKSEVMK